MKSSLILCVTEASPYSISIAFGDDEGEKLVKHGSGSYANDERVTSTSFAVDNSLFLHLITLLGDVKPA